MQDVVRQLVGFGLVAGHVMNLKGPQRAETHGEMLHAPSMHTHVWAMLTLFQYLALVYTNAFRLLQQVSNRVFRFCESTSAKMFYDHYANYSHYNKSANAHNVL
jgi:hypothetical protein